MDETLKNDCPTVSIPYPRPLGYLGRKKLTLRDCSVLSIPSFQSKRDNGVKTEREK